MPCVNRSINASRLFREVQRSPRPGIQIMHLGCIKKTLKEWEKNDQPQLVQDFAISTNNNSSFLGFRSLHEFHNVQVVWWISIYWALARAKLHRREVSRFDRTTFREWSRYLQYRDEASTCRHRKKTIGSMGQTLYLPTFEWLIFMVFYVGKYTVRPMDPMGYIVFPKFILTNDPVLNPMEIFHTTSPRPPMSMKFSKYDLAQSDRVSEQSIIRRWFGRTEFMSTSHGMYKSLCIVG